MFPLDHPYILALPRALEENPHFHIYSFSPSTSPNHHICTLELADDHLGEDEAICWHTLNTGDQRQASEGHFHTDMSQSVFALQLMIAGPEFVRREVLYLIPRTTFLAQIREAEAQKSPRIGGGTQPVPWTDWGSQGCLRLSPRQQYGIRIAHEIPFGSRFPHIVLDESDFRRASVYVFDVNPHVARRERQLLASRQHASADAP
uniref:AAA_12 domain-containing protein n=1 Tax=Ganoderma boninense TaxID=34458 RepID=A0A5K1JTB0_9APHY|nr:AAA_12 domain-containing protein [Ganoderma boninense]